MKTSLSLTFLLLAGSLALNAADPAAAVTAAAKQLAAKGNYSWSSVSEPAGGEQGPRITTDGKTAEGYTFLNMSFGDREFETAIKDGKVAVKNEGEWKSADELEGNRARMVRRFQDFKGPAAEAEALAKGSTNWKTEPASVYAAELTQDGLKELFARFGGRQPPATTDMKGTIKFWINKGLLTKYEYNLKGKFTVGQDQNEVNMDRTTTLQIKDVGTTKVNMPDEARKKLG